MIASDGVWEFISNDEIAKIVKPFYEAKNAEKAAEAVVKESYLRWKREEEGIVDDITCVIVFLDVKLPQQDPSPNLLSQEAAAEKQKQQETEGTGLASMGGATAGTGATQKQETINEVNSPADSSDKKSKK